MRDLIEERCGLRFDDSQRSSLSASVAARMEQLGISSEDEYCDRLRGGAARPVELELRHLLNLVTVTETCFFRDAAQFQLLRAHIVPALLARRNAGVQPPSIDEPSTIRIWSAGCSTGEEAYSIALTLFDMGLYHARREWRFEIIGTDLNTRALEKAEEGVYSARAVRNVEGRLLDQYFETDGRCFRLSDEIRRRVRFEYGNLMQTPMPSTGPQDVVFCKNVAIYFRSSVTRRLVEGLHGTLTPAGYLLLGHAESLWQISEGFALVEQEGAFCYRKVPSAKYENPVPSARIVRSERVHASARRNPAPAPVTSDYEACLSAFRRGEWDAAEDGLQKLIALCPTFVPAYLLLGGVYAHRARYHEAIVLAESALRLTDLEPKAHLLLGMIAARQQRTEDAVQSLRRALYLDDSLALAHFWLGNLYRDRGDLARACLEYANVVRDWDRHTLDLTEEFAADLTAEQIVRFCRDTLQLLKNGDRR